MKYIRYFLRNNRLYLYTTMGDQTSHINVWGPHASLPFLSLPLLPYLTISMMSHYRAISTDIGHNSLTETTFFLIFFKSLFQKLFSFFLSGGPRPRFSWFTFHLSSSPNCLAPLILFVVVTFLCLLEGCECLLTEIELVNRDDWIWDVMNGDYVKFLVQVM